MWAARCERQAPKLGHRTINRGGDTRHHAQEYFAGKTATRDTPRRGQRGPKVAVITAEYM